MLSMLAESALLKGRDRGLIRIRESRVGGPCFFSKKIPESLVGFGIFAYLCGDL